MEFTHDGATQPGLQLTKLHRNMADQHSTLQQDIDRRYPVNASFAVAKATQEFEHTSFKERERLLQGGLTHTEGDQAVCEWVAARYDHLSRIARDCVPFDIKTLPDDRAPLAVIWAEALVLAGQASKWRKISGQRPDVQAREKMHTLYVSAKAAEIDATILKITVEKQVIETTIESLYIRALLLERFSGGNLPPRRLEILDNWLLQSMSSLWLTKEPIEGAPNLCVDPLAPTRALTPYLPGEKARRYLPLRPLQLQVNKIIEGFHRGVIFPGWGLGMTFRIEDHIAVIDFLEREFMLIQGAAAQKSKRLAVSTGDRVTVYLGFNDIYLRALMSQTSLPPTNKSGATNAASAHLAALVKANSETGSFTAFDMIQGPVTLLDISDSGLGLEMTAEDASRVEVDNLMAIRLDENRPCVIGVVARKANVRQAHSVLVGIKVLSRVPMRVTLEEVTDRTARQSMKGILVGGNANTGYGDSIIVNDSAYKANATMNVAIARGMFHIRLGRVRHQGPGWKMTAVEVMVAH
jgi:hypothetical protein